MKRSRFDIACGRYPSVEAPDFRVKRPDTTAYLPPSPPGLTQDYFHPVFHEAFGTRSIEIVTGDIIHFTGGRNEDGQNWWYVIMVRDVRVVYGTCLLQIQAFDSMDKRKRNTETTAREFVPQIQLMFNNKIAKVRRGGRVVFESHPY